MEGFLNLAWLVPIPPFLAFAAIILFLNRNKTVSALTAIGGALLSLLLGWPIAFAAFLGDHFGLHPHYRGCSPFRPARRDRDWVSGGPGERLMLFMASFLLLMIFIYASGYMSFPPHLRAAIYPSRRRKARPALQSLHGLHQPLCHGYVGFGRLKFC